MCELRLIATDGIHAATWRWELAQLELGARTAWPHPGSGQAWLVTGSPRCIDGSLGVC